MPRRTKRSTALVRRRKRGAGLRVAGGRHGKRGAGFKSWLKKANKWLKKTKAVSRVGSVLGDVGVPYAQRVSGVAKKLGYGRRRRVVRRRRKRGGGLGTAGGRYKKRPGRRLPRALPITY